MCSPCQGEWGAIYEAHFHPNTHECYGSFRDGALSAHPHDHTSKKYLTAIPAVLQGKSRLVLGRERHETATGGVEVDVSAGDVVVVPAGVSHRSLSAEGEYRYIGVYPEVRLRGPTGFSVRSDASLTAVVRVTGSTQVAQQFLQGKGGHGAATGGN